MKEKKSIKLIHVILLVAIAIVLWQFVFYDRYKMPEGAEIEVNATEDINVYSETNIYSLIKNSNVEIVTEDGLLKTDEIGTQTVTIEYKYKGFRKYKYDIQYRVVDSVSPIFISTQNISKTFYVNEASEKDVEEIINKLNYADNYDIHPVLDAKYEIDFSRAGSYVVTLTLKDSSNNETEKKGVIEIKERPVVDPKAKKEEVKTEEPVEEKEEEEDNAILFENQIATYKTLGTMVGIDISKWQGEVDFQKVKEAGCEFVIMRIGVMKDKDSELVKDKTFDTNYRNAKQAGLKIGIYVYSEANNVNTAISNAEFIINELNGDKLDFPIAFDWESWSYFNSMEMNLHMLNEMYEAFSKRLEDAGYETMLYGSQNYLNNAWMTLKDYKLWVARYSEQHPEITNGGREYIMWQNSNTGKIDGIDGEVDFDIYYK